MVHRIIKAGIGLVFLSLLVGTQSCYYDNEEELYPESFNCDTTGITYDEKIGAIVAQNCATSGCHNGNSGAIELVNYSAVKAIVDNGKLEERVLVQKNMPPSQNLTTCEYQQLELWIFNGAPEN